MVLCGIDLADLKETGITLLRCRYVIAGSVFLVWGGFFDDDNLFVKYSQRQEIERLEAEKVALEQGIERDKRKMGELRNNRESLEKFAREEYYMKKPDEVIFIVR